MKVSHLSESFEPTAIISHNFLDYLLQSYYRAFGCDCTINIHYTLTKVYVLKYNYVDKGLYEVMWYVLSSLWHVCRHSACPKDSFKEIVDKYTV